MPSPSYPQHFSRFFMLTVLAICLGGATMAAGMGAGRSAVQRFLSQQAPPAEDTPASQPRFGPDPTVYPIDYNEADFTEAIHAVRDAVVSITMAAEVGGTRNEPRIATGSGSGFIFFQDDAYVYVATNNHVIENATRVTISLDDVTHLPARVIATDPSNDLAVLSVALEVLEESGLAFSIAELGDSDALRMGDAVVAIGNALGEGKRTTQGIISALDLIIYVPNPTTGDQLELNVLQTDAAVNRGNSGGPLINEKGEVVGIITAKFMGVGVEGMGYALPINNVRDLMENLRETGSVIIPFMGIRRDEINEETREQFNLPATGIFILSVVPDTPAEEAGLERGDLIVYFNGTRTHDLDSFIRALTDSRVGDTVVLGIYRDSVFMEVEITLGAPR